MQISTIRLITTSVLLFLFLQVQALSAAEATDAARKLLDELTVDASKSPLSADPNWQKPQRIAVLTAGGRAGVPDAVFAELQAAAAGAELLIVDNAETDRHKLRNIDVFLGDCSDVGEDMKQLKWVQHFSAGVESCLAIPAFKDKGVMLSNMGGIYGPGIAEYVIAITFSLARGLPQFQARQMQNKWDRSLVSSYPVQELRGKTMLIAGLGGIGSEIAWRAHALGMKVIATRNSRRAKPHYVDYVGLADELKTLAAQADFIVNATPLTSATTGLYDSAFFAVLKPSAYFINIGRGKSVVTEDLVAALQTGRLAGAGLDVFEPEPLPATHALWQMPNVIITPHISGRSDQVMARFWIFVRENLRRYVNGEQLLNVVNIKKGY